MEQVFYLFNFCSLFISLVEHHNVGNFVEYLCEQGEDDCRKDAHIESDHLNEDPLSRVANFFNIALVTFDVKKVNILRLEDSSHVKDHRNELQC